jgi:hypothetical protein
MKQQTAVRQVSKRYQNGMHLSACMTTLLSDGSQHWRGTIMSPGYFGDEEFAFFGREQEVSLPSSGKGQQMLPPEVRDFARFCVEVTRARI